MSATRSKDVFKYLNKLIASGDYGSALNYSRMVLDASRYDAKTMGRVFLLREKMLHKLGIHEDIFEAPTQSVTIQPKKVSTRVCKKKAKKHYNSGMSFYNQKDYQNALICFTKAIQLNLNYSEALLQRGITNYFLSKYNDAIADLNQAVVHYPNHFLPYNCRGASYQGLGRYGDALIDDSKAIELLPNDSILYFNRAVDYYQLKDFKMAITDFSMAIKLKPDSGCYYPRRGVTYCCLNQFNEALKDYNKAIKLDSKNDSNYTARGDFFLKLNNFGKAIEDYTKAIELKPDSFDHYIKRAKAYHLDNQLALAFVDENKAHQLNKLPSLKDMCKFFILNNHGRVVARNSVRHYIQGTPLEHGVTDKLREVLERNNITPDTIELKRKQQGLIPGMPTLFDEIRREEELILRCGTDDVVVNRKNA